MALTASRCAADIVTRIEARNQVEFDADARAELILYWTDICDAVFTEIKDYAVITIQPGTTANGVQSGGSNVPVTGTGKVTA